jgi:hypothetical protein
MKTLERVSERINDISRENPINSENQIEEITIRIN